MTIIGAIYSEPANLIGAFKPTSMVAVRWLMQ
jgi:hypothetical protein